MTLNVDIVDSADGHNPVIRIEQSGSPHVGTIQINKYEAASLKEKLKDKIKELNSEVRVE